MKNENQLSETDVLRSQHARLDEFQAELEKLLGRLHLRLEAYVTPDDERPVIEVWDTTEEDEETARAARGEVIELEAGRESNSTRFAAFEEADGQGFRERFHLVEVFHCDLKRDLERPSHPRREPKTKARRRAIDPGIQ